MNDEVKLILKKLEIVSSIEEPGAYICDKEHSKILLNYIKELEDNLYASNQAVNELLDIKKLCDTYEEEHKTTFKVWLQGQRALKELEELLKKDLENEEDVVYSNIEVKDYIKYTLDKIQELKEKYKNE